MSKDLSLALTINVDKEYGESNLRAFSKSFEEMLRSMGKSEEDIKLFKTMAFDIKRGKLALEDVDDETKKLYQTWEEGSKVAADKDFLGLRAHSDIQKEIDATREAYERIKASGTLTHEELAQAALKTEERIRELNHQTNGWSDALMNAKGSIAALAGSAVGMTKIIGSAIDFESAMSDVKKVVDGTDEQVAALTGRIKEMSSELPISANGLAEIAAAGGRMGIAIDKLDQFIELSAKIATAFNMSAEEAGDAVAKLSNIFDLPLEGVEALGDAINALGNNAAASEKDILEVLSRIGGMASQFKLSAEQGAALAATMLEMGVPAQVAGTSINALLSRLQTANVQSPQFQQALDNIGISATQLADDIRKNPQEALTAFLRTLESMDDKARSEALVNLFGDGHQAKIALLINGLDKYEASLDRVADKSKTAGAMQKEFDERISATETQLKLMKNGLEAIAINLGSIFLPAVRDMAMLLGDASQAIAKFVESNPKIAGLATTLATVAMSASALRLVFLSLGVAGAKAFSGMKDEIDRLKMPMSSLTKEVGLLGAAARSVSAGMAAWEIGTSIGTWLHEEFESARRAGNRLAQAFTLVMESAAAAFKVLKNPGKIGEIWDEYTASIKHVNQIYAEMADDIGTANDEFSKSGKKAADSVKNTEKAVKAAGDAAAEAGEKVDGLANSFDQLDLTKRSGVNGYIELVKKAGNDTEKLDEQFTEWLSNANTADLSAFHSELTYALALGKVGFDEFDRLSLQVLQQSFANLGVNASLALGGISDTAQEAINSIDTIRETMARTGIVGTQAMTALEQAIQGAIGKADSASAIAMLGDQIKSLGDSGELSAQQVERLKREMQEQSEVINAATPGIQSVEEAFKQLGMTSQTELERAASSAKEAFSAIQQLGGSIEQQQAAFAPYAKAAIAAFDGMSESQKAQSIELLRAKAAEIGILEELEDQLYNASDASEDAGEKAEQGTEKAASGAKKAKEETKKLGDTIEDVGDKSKSMGASFGGAINAIAGRLHALSQATQDAFFGAMGMIGGARQAESELERMQNRLDQIKQQSIESQNWSGLFAQSFGRVERAANEAEGAYLSQKIALEKLVEQFEKGEVSADWLTEATWKLESQFGMLNDADLSRLESAIDSVKSRTDALNDSLENTVSNLEKDIANLKGQQDVVEEMNHKERVAELEHQKQLAQMSGDAKALELAQQALKLEEERFKIKMDNIKASQEEANQRKQEREQKQTEKELDKDFKKEADSRKQTESSFQQQTKTATSDKMITVKFDVGGSSSYGEFSDTQINSLIRKLQEIGAVSR